jgi:hypothetical protein
MAEREMRGRRFASPCAFPAQVFDVTQRTSVMSLWNSKGVSQENSVGTVAVTSQYSQNHDRHTQKKWNDTLSKGEFVGLFAGQLWLSTCLSSPVKWLLDRCIALECSIFLKRFRDLGI